MSILLKASLVVYRVLSVSKCNKSGIVLNKYAITSLKYF